MREFDEPTAEQIESQKVYRDLGLTDGEFALIKTLLGRKPNYTETGLYSVMWSEHCSYKNSKPVLRLFPTAGPQVLQGPGEGAGIVDIGDGQAVVFKMESHNHPSAIEPYQGAATGVGGIIRDVFSMGARPIALLNSLRFGDLKNERTKYLFREVVAGIAGYGNCVGIPTVGGEIYFDESYEGNPLVNAMCVGLIEQTKIQQGIARGVGNPVLYVGASTGRDGIHGATFASEELNEASESKRPAVQVGDPFMEKLLIEACLELIDTGAVEGIQDMGAAGLASSSSEMASKAGNGVLLDLDQVPQRESNMSAYEMMLSESQERMLLVVKAGREDDIVKVCDKWGLNCVNIGHVTDDGRMRLLHEGVQIADVPVDSLADKAPVYHKPSHEPKQHQINQYRAELPVDEDLTQVLLRLLAVPTIASKEWVYSQYDYMVRTDTIVVPGASAAVIRIRGTQKALAFSTDCCSSYLALDPEMGGRAAVAEAARNVVCTGAKPLAITNCLNFGSPENPEVFWQLEKAVAGMSEACRVLHTPVVSGNVSLYNETKGRAIDPTPVVGMVGLIDDISHVTTSAWERPGDAIVLFGDTRAEWGGSQLQKLVTGCREGCPPIVDLTAEKALQELVLDLIHHRRIQTAHDLSEGGLAVALAECSINSQLGAVVNLKTPLDPSAVLFSESQSRILISAAPEALQDILATARDRGVPAMTVGQTAEKDFSVVVNDEQVIQCSVHQLSASWKDAISCALTTA